MTEQETRVCLAAVYEIYRKQLETSNPDEYVNLWHRYLCDEPAELVQMAFDKWIATEKWAPKPSEILELVESAKGDLYSEAIAIDLFDNRSVVERLAEIPREYMPRYVTRRPKQFEVENQKRIMARIEGADKIGLIE